MRTKTFILLCLFLSIGLTQLSAQFPPVIPDGTKSVVWTIVIPDWTEYVECNGVADVLTGEITLVETDLFKNGVMTRGINHCYGTLTSQTPPYEVFKLHENIKGYFPYDEFGNYTNGTWHFNFIGNYGTHYMGAGTFYEDGSFSIDKAGCPGNSKK